MSPMAAEGGDLVSEGPRRGKGDSARTADAGQALARAADERAAHPASTRATNERAEHDGDVRPRAADSRISGKGEHTAGTSRPR